jgi:hypothetical protein
MVRRNADVMAVRFARKRMEFKLFGGLARDPPDT